MSARGQEFHTGDVHDYPCPSCGYDGPHPVLFVIGEEPTVECGDVTCALEFTVPVDADS